MNIHRGSAVAVITLIVVLLAGCANPPAHPTAGSGGSVSGGPSLPNPPSGPARSAPVPYSPLPPATPPASVAMTLHGAVYAGVEPNCVLLNQTGVSYLLLGGDRALLREGNTVTVTGRVVRGIMTTCQQGVPFQVDTVHLG